MRTQDLSFPSPTFMPNVVVINIKGIHDSIYSFIGGRHREGMGLLTQHRQFSPSICIILHTNPQLSYSMHIPDS